MRPELQAKFAAAEALSEGATDLQATFVEALTLEALGVPVFEDEEPDRDQYGWGDKIGAWE